MPSPPTLRLANRDVCLHTGNVEGWRALTATERRLLERLFEDVGQDVSRADLWVDVFGYAPATRSRTLDTTVRRLRAKVDTDPPQHILTVVGVGYRLELEAPSSASPAWMTTLLRELQALRAPGRVVTVVGWPTADFERLLAALPAPVQEGRAAWSTHPEPDPVVVDGRGRRSEAWWRWFAGRPADVSVCVVSHRPLGLPDEVVRTVPVRAPVAAEVGAFRTILQSELSPRADQLLQRVLVDETVDFEALDWVAAEELLIRRLVTVASEGVVLAAELRDVRSELAAAG